jgi:hypothetical protein
MMDLEKNQKKEKNKVSRSFSVNLERYDKNKEFLSNIMGMSHSEFYQALECAFYFAVKNSFYDPNEIPKRQIDRAGLWDKVIVETLQNLEEELR